MATTGSRVRIRGGEATGTLERVRPDGACEVRWDTGARCAVPADWLEPRCERCGVIFGAERTTARYCSAACRTAAHRERVTLRPPACGDTGTAAKSRDAAADALREAA